MDRLPNLKIYLRTAVVGTARDPATGRITSLTTVRRKPIVGAASGPEWSQRLSLELPDWYSGKDYAAFTKEILRYVWQPCHPPHRPNLLSCFIGGLADLRNMGVG